MYKANIRLMGMLCPKIKLEIRNLFDVYQWVLIISLVFFVSCLSLAQEVTVQNVPPVAKADRTHEYTTDEATLNRILKFTPDADFTRFPMIKYNLDHSEIVGLKIGDDMPDELWDMPLWVVNHPEGKDTIRLREYQNEKLLVLDFWAKYCSPCLQSMDKWDGYVKEMNEQVKLIGVNIDYDYKALPVSKERGWDSPTIIGKEGFILGRHFFKRDLVSRIVWIKNDKIFAITGVGKLDQNVVEKVLKNEDVVLPMSYRYSHSEEEVN